ncbi:MAG: hypothetical protein HQ569_03755, partial [Actinobacteria bacterium]|nr:hypothetical protein [Actinomycetota bacterium]
TQTFIDFAGSKMKITINGAYDFVNVRDVAVGHINTLQSNSYKCNLIFL